MNQNLVLFVDDEPNITSALKRSLRREPYEILSATSAQEALELLATRNVDVVISDEKMPGMSGSEFLAEVCRRYPTTICMMLTGQASLDAAIRAINEGEVYRFFTKPCNDADLRVTIRHAIQQQNLARQSRRLLQICQEQNSLIDALERENPGVSRVATDASGAILVDAIEGDVDDLLRQIEQQLQGRDPSPPA